MNRGKPTVVTLGGLEFSPGPHAAMPRRSGLFFRSIVDWYSLAEAKSSIRERPGADGAFGIAWETRQSLPLSMPCLLACDSREELSAARRALKGALGGRTPVTMTVDDLDGPTSRVVSIRSMPLPDDFASTELEFAIDMIAFDANRYGPEVVTTTGLPTSGGGIPYPFHYPISYGIPGDSGRLTVSNPGTEDTVSMLEVTGGLGGGFELTDVPTGRVLRYVEAVPLDSTVFLNPRTGSVYIDVPTNDKSRALVRRDWFTLPAGETHEIQFNAIGSVTGTPTLTARTSPAF
jgi:hypothetical protein